MRSRAVFPTGFRRCADFWCAESPQIFAPIFGADFWCADFCADFFADFWCADFLRRFLRRFFVRRFFAQIFAQIFAEVCEAPIFAQIFRQFLCVIFTHATKHFARTQKRAKKGRENPQAAQGVPRHRFGRVSTQKIRSSECAEGSGPGGGDSGL